MDDFFRQPEVHPRGGGSQAFVNIGMYGYRRAVRPLQSGKFCNELAHCAAGFVALQCTQVGHHTLKLGILEFDATHRCPLRAAILAQAIQHIGRAVRARLQRKTGLQRLDNLIFIGPHL